MHAEIRDEMHAAVTESLDRGDYILGEAVASFEREFAQYCGTAHALGVDSGTSALELALRAVGVGAGDEVILPANTFVATALAVHHAGATPVLADIDPHTYNIEPALLERAITSRTKAVVPVHLYGRPAAMAEINAIAAKHGLVVVEDACQAHGAAQHDVRTGGLGHIAAFSFYPGKNLGACGDGGAVTTNDEKLADNVVMLRNYGQRKKYHHLIKGFNRRLDTLQAAVLRTKLPHLDRWNAARRQAAAVYAELLEDSGVAAPRTTAGVDPVWHLFVVEVDDRDRVQQELDEAGIQTGLHYPIPIHLLPAFEELGYKPGAFPVTEAAAERILSLPMHPHLTREEIERVVGALRQAVRPRSFAMAAGAATAANNGRGANGSANGVAGR